MYTGSPYSKDTLSLKRGLRVLEVGPGSNPTRRADVLAEKFISDNKHRRGNLRVYPHQTLIEADGEHLPFADKEFDYVICCHVLEHAEDPAHFISELCRVAKAGYLETPSLIGELLAPKDSHKWVLLNVKGKLVLWEKSQLGYTFGGLQENLFLNYLPYHSLPYRLLNLTRPNFMNVRYEWRDGVDFLVNPSEPEYKAYFTDKWSMEMSGEIFPGVSGSKELMNTLKALSVFAVEKLKRSLNIGSKPVDYCDL